MSSFFSKKDGSRIVLRFTEELIGEIEDNLEAFAVEGQEERYLGGPLVPGEYEIEALAGIPQGEVTGYEEEDTVKVFKENGLFVAAGVASVHAFVVGGGGGGGGTDTTSLTYVGGGGGAGGIVDVEEYDVSGKDVISIIVGSGGSGGLNISAGENGHPSHFGSLVALGGGGGGSRSSPYPGRDGGCGGGRGRAAGSYYGPGTALQPLEPGPAGIFGYGTNGSSSSQDGGGAGGKVAHTRDGRIFEGLTYGVGGEGARSLLHGAPNTGNGGSGAGGYPGAGGNGGSGIVVVKYRKPVFSQRKVKKIVLAMKPAKRFNNVVGDLTVKYNSTAGTLAGKGGQVGTFEKMFAPTDLVPLPIPRLKEKVHVAVVDYELLLNSLMHIVVGDGPYPTGTKKYWKEKRRWGRSNNEKIWASIVGYDVSLTNVEDIEP